MKLYTTLEQQLKKEPNFVTDNGELKKWVVLNKAQNFDEELIGLLLDNADLKEKFFVNVKGTLVFNQNLFVQFLEQKNYLNDSYTQFKNKVGLTIDGKYLKQRNEVALVWPFKDCILEGGQSREEDKREEIFFNEILAQDEITQLLEPKVLTNVKRLDKDGEKPLDQFNRNENGTITDNLIIKGNNLLALHTLKEEFAGKIKLIYIDPPFNTGSDSFRYNDSFNQSSWLTFMKNRLEVSKQLLSKEGVIYIHIDDNEAGYLKVLCDDVFGKENFVNEIIVTTNKPFGFKGTSDSLFKQANHIYLYAKNKQAITLNRVWIERDYDTAYNMVFNDFDKPENEWTWESIDIATAKSLGFENKAKALEHISKAEFEDKIALFALNNAERVFQTAGVSGGAFIKRKKTIEKSAKVRDRLFRHPNDDMDYIFLKGRRVIFYKERLIELNGAKIPGELITDTWTDIAIEGIAKEGNVDFSRGKKPEKLISRILELSSNENDIVLDFFAGSGTTGAVAHKMKRQYILCEQMDYVEELPINRIKGVIDGDQSGISKSVNWKGGGEFVYLELKKYNQTFIEQIKAANDTETLLQIWEQMKAKSFFKYSVDLQKFQESIEEFKQFELKKQREILCELLDKNQLYVNLSSLNDADFACTEDEKKVTKDFYQIKK
jgi:adenine-specific DNA-methyltransferase